MSHLTFPTNQLQVLKCFVQSDHPFVVERGHAYIRLAGLAQPGCKEVITDIEELGLYDEAATRLSVGQDGTEMANIICRIRLAAVKASPKNEKLGIDCFRACLLRTNWDYAQQVCHSQHTFQDRCDILGIYPFQTSHSVTKDAGINQPL